MRRSPLLADLFLGSRIRSTPRSLRIAPPLDFGKEALKVFALICMVTRAFRRRPSIDHDAQRLGFQYEGTFRQATIVKGRNRDTAWFSVIDGEWPALKERFTRWLDPSNFDAEGRQLQRLEAC